MKLLHVFLMSFSLITLAFAEEEKEKKISNESEVSYVSQSGNSDQKTFSGETKTIYSLKKWEFSLGGMYTYGESFEIRNAENWNVEARSSYKLGKVYKVFAGELVEANRFAGVKRRYNHDLGTEIRLYKSKNASAKMEVGYRYTSEKRTDYEERKDSKGRAFLSANRQITKTLKGTTTFEYLPNFTESEDYQMNWDSNLSFFISKILSLKMSYLWQFDNQPTTGKTEYDRITKTSLVASF